MIDFNKIYVIQSLDESKGDELTGTQLYNEVLQYFNLKYPHISAELIDINTPIEFNQALDKIKTECINDKIKPIIHFEIHGLENKKGLSLNKGDILWINIYDNLIDINEASKWNLFLTMGVCFGNYAMFLLNPRKKAPFTGIIGSFEELFEWDLYIRYNAFYLELLNTLNFSSALEALHNSNPALPDDYRYVNAEQTFKNIYQKYLDNEFTVEKINKRFIEALKKDKMSFSDRNVKHLYYNQFRAKLQRTKRETYKKDKEVFFMFDIFPENKNIFCLDWEPKYSK